MRLQKTRTGVVGDLIERKDEEEKITELITVYFTAGFTQIIAVEND